MRVATSMGKPAMIDTSPFCKEASCETSVLVYCRYAPVINSRNAADKDKDGRASRCRPFALTRSGNHTILPSTVKDVLTHGHHASGDSGRHHHIECRRHRECRELITPSRRRCVRCDSSCSWTRVVG